MEKQNEKRVLWIDVVRGIGIFLVVLGHSFWGGHNVIYAFHMPLFFFVSGALFKDISCPYKDYFVKRLRTLIIPYVFFGLISILLAYIRNEMEIDVWQCLKQIAMGRRGKIDINQALWFLPTLFIVENIYFFIRKILKNKMIRVCFCFGLSFWAYSSISEPRLWFGLDGAVYYLVFFLLGNLLFNVLNKSRDAMALKIMEGACGVCVLFFTVQPTLYNNIFIYILGASQIFQFAYSVIAACIGIIACVGLAIRLEKSALLKFWGENTLVILGCHLFLLDSAYYFAISIGMNINQDSNIYSIIITIIVLALHKPLINICNDYFPEFIGKKRRSY